jgi:hypothetical protein
VDKNNIDNRESNRKLLARVEVHSIILEANLNKPRHRLVALNIISEQLHNAGV